MRQLKDEDKRLTLREWMEQNDVKNDDFARNIGCSVQTVIHWKKGVFIPHRFHKSLIIKETNNEVKI